MGHATGVIARLPKEELIERTPRLLFSSLADSHGVNF
jgi:hypothetical protein